MKVINVALPDFGITRYIIISPHGHLDTNNNQLIINQLSFHNQ